MTKTKFNLYIEYRTVTGVNGPLVILDNVKVIIIYEIPFFFSFSILFYWVIWRLAYFFLAFQVFGGRGRRGTRRF